MKININGVHYYCEWFSTYETDRPTLVCFHGFTGTSQTFAPVFQEESEWNILGIDLIGHGNTDCYVHPYRYQMECLCQDLALLTEELGLVQFSLLGYSMGARVALGFTQLFPSKIQNLILESGSPGLENVMERLSRQLADERLAGSILNQPIERFVEKWENLSLFKSQKALPFNVQCGVRQERLSQHPFGLACSLWFMGTGVQSSYWQELPKIKVSILLIVGELDLKFQQIAKNMKERQPNIVIELVKDTGHCVHLEKPRTFERIVHMFLRGGTNNENPSH
ncbi:2-succinyl-6-hydroxy-2,4-cyclohexadiene-1-carboxylate synthase [Candidatus Enterococcus mansonii]|uniref:Putative 2-succinyl-6-hydroxy-2,4-cyclohexadiene-1-carboxylate synthase n=1 Tax=Candidatus Enterococcus mansonii TaxID=1834181 RepID=A0A242CED2_9ENTE|nr:2-succinyl-6-hydroxy-2,4-cyclohexadiene-1-carboxylate synthase [Enterococcus sp. 4G2_DIV0659]OTO08478.1 2-succinyl-6-hydroxy-2,4-cyclohexadiene-1-carboxylate synthase [Enterococcus sp. 4G2_DIV0659]